MQNITRRIAFAALQAAGLALAVVALQPGAAEARNNPFDCIPDSLYESMHGVTGCGDGGGGGGGDGGSDGGGGSGGGGGGTAGGSTGGGGTTSPTFPGHIMPGPWNWNCNEFIASLVTGATQCERDFDSWAERLCELPENAGHPACGGRKEARDWISEGGY
jgi:hypothetical protein